MKSVAVIGGTAGIGFAITRRLAEDGYSVVATGRNLNEAQRLNGVEAVELDLTSSESLDAGVQNLVARCPDVSSLVLSAGVGRFGSLDEFSNAQIREMMHVNIIAHMIVVRAFVAQLRRHNNGHIVFIGSEAALRAGRKGAVYSASKFALRGFAQALRFETSNRNLSVSVVNPGMVRTGFFDALDFEPGPEPQHALEVDDVADAVAMIFATRPGTVIDEINLSPRQHVVRRKLTSD